jgi:hypothetical protein
MKLRGVIKGQTIELDIPTGLAEGQQVEVEIRVPDELVEAAAEKERAARRRYPTPEELEARIAADPEFEEIRMARKLRNEQEQRGGVYHGSIVVRMRAARAVAEDIAFEGWSTPEELEARFIAALQIENSRDNVQSQSEDRGL